jgi:alpha-methylacyl-CoA racemase
MEGTDICFAPVLSLAEAPHHPHNRARGTFVEVDGALQPAPAPRFSATPTAVSSPPCASGTHTDEILVAAGYSAAEVADLREAGVVGG